MAALDYYPKLIPGGVYHIFNHSNSEEKLFYKDENYFFFLQRYAFYLNSFLETFAYNLLQNHFHLLVRIFDDEQLMNQSARPPSLHSEGKLFKKRKVLYELRESRTAGSSETKSSAERGERKKQPLNSSEIVSEQFRKLFLSYSKAINKQEQRKGSLFREQFKRVRVEDAGHFKNVMYYIHHNASHHGYEVADIDYPFSSYQAFLSEKKTRLKREEVLLMFGGKEKFESFHNQTQNLKSIEDFIIEEDD